MPSELSLLLPMNAAYHYLVLRIIDFRVFLKENYLVSIICLPFTNNATYNLCHILPLTIKVEKTEFKFILIQNVHIF
jgi:hypothetical protein